jgi:CheY-like chemotaxis protein
VHVRAPRFFPEQRWEGPASRLHDTDVMSTPSVTPRPAPAYLELGRPLDILVVDDERTSRDGLALALRALGHEWRVAASGEDALLAIAARRPDVVISDWQMPGMTGDELCRRARSTVKNAPYTYFIILTAYSDREHVLAGMAAGADDHQCKPVDLDELEGRLLRAARVVALDHRGRERLPSRTDETFSRVLAQLGETALLLNRTSVLLGKTEPPK